MKIFFKTGLLLTCFLPSLCMSDIIQDIRINKDNHKFLKQFILIDDPKIDTTQPEQPHALIAEHTTSDKNTLYIRYQQYYQDIKVIGRSVVAHYPKNASKTKKTTFTGKLTKGLSMAIEPYYLSDHHREEMVRLAQNDYQELQPSFAQSAVSEVNTQPIIWIDDEEESATFAYIVSFRMTKDNGKVSWPHYMIDATRQDVLNRWNNIQTLQAESGPGGNRKTGQYQYGQEGLPSLETTVNNNTCYLANNKLRVVTANNTWSLRNPSSPTPVNHPCSSNNGDASNGAWSPANDAFMFGNMVIDMYQDWYGQPILTNTNGTQKQLTLVVHAGNNYENAAWNGQYMIFGDGHNSYHPLVSLGVTSHELAHAFTTSHSNLLYFNQSGAVNEAFSDMSAIAAEYYLQQNHAQGYQTIYNKSGLDWLIGDRIAKGNYALRSMNQPHLFSSADCELSGSGCHKTWADIIRLSKQAPYDQRQSFIVHKGSGVFNRAFYEMVLAFNGDVKKVFHMMVKANMTRWTASSDFSDAACGVKQVATDLGYDVNKVKQAFTTVQITPDC